MVRFYDNDPDPDDPPWFGPKRSGYGIGPRGWQGWALTLGTVLVSVVACVLAVAGISWIVVAALLAVVSVAVMFLLAILLGARR